MSCIGHATCASGGFRRFEKAADEDARVELKSEHACTTDVNTIEAINPIATSEKTRLDMSVFVRASKSSQR
jgi:hypothetical protein